MPDTSGGGADRISVIRTPNDDSAMDDTNDAVRVNVVTGAGGTSMTDDSAFTVESSSGTPAFFLVDETTTDTVAEGRAGAGRMDASRRVLTRIVGATDGNRLDVDSSGHAQVDIAAASVAVAVTQSGTWDEVGINDSGNKITVDWNGTDPPIGAGLEATALRVTVATDSTGVLSVDDNGAALSIDDGGNVISVDWNGTAPPIGAGTEAAALRVTVATDSTGVVSVDDNGAALSIDDGGNVISVDWNGTAPPIGAGTEAAALRVTVATDSTGVLSVDDNGASLTVDNAHLTSLGGAISGTEVQVDVVAALPAGTNAIGKLAANSGVDIGDVDVTSMVSGTLDHGANRDIDATAEQITTTSFACKFGVVLKADAANSGTVYIGNSDVTAGTTDATDGAPLAAGESLFLPVNNVNIPYAIGSAANQVVYWLGV